MSKSNKINLISNRNFQSRKTSQEIIEKFQNRGYQITKQYEEDAELNVIVGGDGAFLRAVHRHKFPTIPYIGINTGNLGFFQEIKPEEIDQFVLDYTKSNYSKEEIFLVEAQVKTRSRNFQLKAINEIVVKTIGSKVIHLDLFLDGNHLEKFSGDGLIISTPAGSTAYNMSIGGAIVYPSLRTLQISPLAPINSKVYRSLLNSLVIPGDLEIRIVPEKRYKNTTLLVSDGMEFKYRDIISIHLKISKSSIYRLNFDQNGYWNNLKSKFL